MQGTSIGGTDSNNTSYSNSHFNAAHSMNDLAASQKRRMGANNSVVPRKKPHMETVDEDAIFGPSDAIAATRAT